MERNIDDFLNDPELTDRLSSLTEDEFYSELEKVIYETITSSVTPFEAIQPTNTGDTKLDPLNKQSATREYAYGGKASTVIRRQDKIDLSKNKDYNVVKSAIRSSFEAIIAISSKTDLSGQITSVLRQTEQRLFQKIDQKLRANNKN